MSTSETTSSRWTGRFNHNRRSTLSQKLPDTGERSHRLLSWVLLVGIFLPPIQIFIFDTKFTPGRIVVLAFLVPALGILLRRGRNWVVSDFSAAAVMIWMILSSILNGGYRPSVVAEALEFFGAYLIGRAFFAGRVRIQTFMQTFGIVTVILVACALLDTLAGRAFTLETTAKLFPLPQFGSGSRFGWERANSTFGHAELLGTFCVAATAIFLYSDRKRLFYSGVSIVGTAFSLSSGPWLGLVVVLSIFCYDRILKSYPWRWKVLVIILGGMLLGVLVISNNPIGWVIRHLTFNPQTGYWRVSQWDAALTLIGQSPMLGFGVIVHTGGQHIDLFINQSVDCVWLVEALRYGLPAVVLLLLTIFAPFWSAPGYSLRTDSYMASMRTGFSLAVIAMGLIGLTVHFWDSPWIFFSLCMGIRASFAETNLSRDFRPKTVAMRRAPH